MKLIVPLSYCDALPHCTALFERAQQNAHSEVEGKLGFFDQRGNFDSGVSLQTFNKLLVCMNSSTSWDRVIDWTDSQDFYFENNIRGTVSGEDEDTVFISKVQVEHLNLRAPQRTLSLRVSCKLEEPAQPITAFPLTVRIKKRKEFYYRDVVFCFTYVWQGHNLAEAQSRQPRYEIEIECTELKHPKGAEYLALSMLMKLGDLLNQVEPQDTQLHLEVF